MTTTLQKEADATMSDEQKYEIMFGKPYKDNNRDPWRGQ